VLCERGACDGPCKIPSRESWVSGARSPFLGDEPGSLRVFRMAVPASDLQRGGLCYPSVDLRASACDKTQSVSLPQFAS